MNCSKTIRTLQFDNAIIQKLPVQKEIQAGVLPKVAGACFSKVEPTPIAKPKLVSYSKSALELLGIDVSTIELDRNEFSNYVCGNTPIPGSNTMAHCYAGHQFGYFSGQLGDGATMYCGEVLHNGKRWELQFKGAGKTPYSRNADGRKVLRSSIREFLCSEHLHALGIPTTRAGTIVTSETMILRDVFYDGNPEMEPATVITRIAPTFFRFGSFEIFKPIDPHSGRSGPSFDLPNRNEMLALMLDTIIEQYFPHIQKSNHQESYIAFFTEVVQRTAELVAKWNCYGFCHGVLNTDNMSILGLTIDYGPFGFMEHYNPDFICNRSDEQGRYSYKQQKEICKWNCSVLAEQIAPVAEDTTPYDEALKSFDFYYRNEYERLMRNKLGIIKKRFDGDESLYNNFWETMESTGGDFTMCFRTLSDLNIWEDNKEFIIRELVKYSFTLTDIQRKHTTLIPQVHLERFQKIIESDGSMLVTLAHHFQVPPSFLSRELLKYQESVTFRHMNEDDIVQRNHDAWSRWINMYIKRLKAESDSAPDILASKERVLLMNAHNPVYVLRNHVAQKAIQYAQQGEYEKVNHILELLQHPFERSQDPSDEVYASPLPPTEPEIMVT